MYDIENRLKVVWGFLEIRLLQSQGLLTGEVHEYYVFIEWILVKCPYFIYEHL